MCTAIPGVEMPPGAGTSAGGGGWVVATGWGAGGAGAGAAGLHAAAATASAATATRKVTLRRRRCLDARKVLTLSVVVKVVVGAVVLLVVRR